MLKLRIENNELVAIDGEKRTIVDPTLTDGYYRLPENSSNRTWIKADKIAKILSRQAEYEVPFHETRTLNRGQSVAKSVTKIDQFLTEEEKAQIEAIKEAAKARKAEADLRAQIAQLQAELKAKLAAAKK